MREISERCINGKELITIWVGWEKGCKDPYNQQQAVLLALLLEFD
jgi:hypothetical protein